MQIPAITEYFTSKNSTHATSGIHKTYIYAKRENQLRHANCFAQIGYMAFYVIALVTQWIACAMKIQTVKTSCTIPYAKRSV